MQLLAVLSRSADGAILGVSLVLAMVSLAGCGSKTEPLVLERLPPVTANATASSRISGKFGTPEMPRPVEISLASPGRRIRRPAGIPMNATDGDVSLNFVDTDIREVVAQILGIVLRVNYTIDSSVHGSVTLRTSRPLPQAELLPTLQTLLAQNGATLVSSGGVYRILPIKDAAEAPGLVDRSSAAGIAVVPLRYTSGEQLAKVLQPYVARGGKIVAEPGRNALLISGDPATRDTLIDLVHAFDIDLLAGQSYALLPVATGDAKDAASSLQDALRAQSNGPMAGLVRAVPMQRISSILVVASQPALINDVRRVYSMLESEQRKKVRSWHVYFLQNSRANDVAYVLQQAFTPSAVTAQPGGPGTGKTAPSGLSNIGLGGTMGGGLLGGGASLGAAAPGAATPVSLSGTAPTAAPPGTTAAPSNPLLGGLEAGTAPAEAHQLRIIPNSPNNSLLIFATQQEEDTINAMLRKIDIIPLQVRIDATIAEVDLNDQLQYGTQYFFKQGGVNGALAAAFPAGAPGFLLAGGNAQQVALSLLQSVTKVRVLSSPEILVLDNQPAQLQVGDLVPYLTATSQSTLVSGAPVINSINYMQTGVIMQVTPRVNSGGLVMLDIVQVVSDVDPSTTTAGISSPAFQERTVQSHIVVQDGQTVGLAGLIRDNVSRQNQGVPWVKDIPLVGALFGQQSNIRSRTELLVLITPHVVRDQRSARALTEDLREQMINAALVPQELRRLGPGGSSDPNARLRSRIGSE